MVKKVSLQQIDILIIGGGLIGATLLLALSNQGYRLLLVDEHHFNNKSTPDFDARTLALSPASVKIFEMLQVWPLLNFSATPINMIHISQQQHFGAAKLHASSAAALGYVVDIQKIYGVLHSLLNQEQILAPAQLTTLDPKTGIANITTNGTTITVKADLIIAADGAESTVRRIMQLKTNTKNYPQQAVVTNIELARGHNNAAYERFTKSGPLALLPMRENCMSLVWAVEHQQATQLREASDQEFLRSLQRAFGYRLGRFVRTGSRTIFPLRQIIMEHQIHWPCVFVGNAVHTLHPVAGQGFNLGLRDVATLAQCILRYGLNAAMLQQYATLRHHDQTAIVRMVDMIMQIFTSNLPGLALLRNLSLITLDNVTLLKKCLSHYMQGFAGVAADLICGIQLEKYQNAAP